MLNFMGDGLLAIFPTEGKGPRSVCAAALAAAREARSRILAMMRSTALGSSCAEPPFALALHIGEVLYGNVGGGHRLDFTVIGPADFARIFRRAARATWQLHVAWHQHHAVGPWFARRPCCSWTPEREPCVRTMGAAEWQHLQSMNLGI